MSQPSERPGTIEPGDVPQAVDAPNPGLPGGADVSGQIAALTEVVNQLARLQQQQRPPQEPPPVQRGADAPAGDAAAADARERYVREHLGDLPEAYRRQMPQGGDASQLADAEQAIRRQFREDLRVTLGSAAAPDVGGDIPGGQGPAAGVDYARMSPVQQIALGLRDVMPVGPGRAAVVRAPAPGDAERESVRQNASSGAD